MRAIIAAAVMCLVINAACVHDVSTAPGSPEFERTVEVALLEYLISQRLQPGDRTICIGMRMVNNDLQPRDPTPTELNHIKTGRQKVVPASECQLRDFAGPMIHVPTGDRAVTYEVTLVRLSANRAELHGAWYAASLVGESCKYKARKDRNRGWVFTREENCVVS